MSTFHTTILMVYLVFWFIFAIIYSFPRGKVKKYIFVDSKNKTVKVVIKKMTFLNSLFHAKILILSALATLHAFNHLPILIYFLLFAIYIFIGDFIQKNIDRHLCTGEVLEKEA